MDNRLTHEDTKVKASSVLNKQREFAASNVFKPDDGQSCWNSDQGLPQWLVVDLEQSSHLSWVQLTFQGGFVGTTGTVELLQSPKEPKGPVILSFEADDVNANQRFAIDDAAVEVAGRYARISFHTSSDFYGRITVYELALGGRREGTG